MVIDLCANIGANTGKIKCDARRGVPEMLLIGTAAFTEAQYCGDLRTAIMDAVNLPAGAPGKLFPVSGIDNIVDNTEDNTTGTTGRGKVITFREGLPAYTFGSTEIGINLEKQLRKLNRQSIPVFVIDNNNNMWGYLNGAGEFVGYDATFFVDGKPFGDEATVDLEYTNINVNFSSAAQFFDYVAFAKLAFPYTDIEGLLDATLVLKSHVDEVHTYGVVVKNANLCNDIDLVETYGAELADAALFAGATSGTSGTPLAVTTVTHTPGTSDIVVTYNSVAYALIPDGDIIRQPFASPAALAVEGVTGVEVLTLTFVKEPTTT